MPMAIYYIRIIQAIFNIIMCIYGLFTLQLRSFGFNFFALSLERRRWEFCTIKLTGVDNVSKAKQSSV